jgi:hypothetical protein
LKRQSETKPLDIAFGVGAAAAAALLFSVTLATIGAPGDFKTRLATLEQQADRAESLLRPSRMRDGYDAGALCTRDPAAQAQAFRDLVSAQATQTGLNLDSLDARVEPAPEVSARLTPVRLRFSVTGPYDGAVGLLALLSRGRPELFVDSLDLTPKVSNVTLSLSGRVFCGA